MIDPHPFRWRSLDEYAAQPDSKRHGEAEFDDTPLRHPDSPGRRDFLRVTGFVVAAEAISGCSRAPVRTASPLPSQPEGYWQIGRASCRERV